jgi:hypothetical protein
LVKDNLREINQAALDAAIAESCVLLVFLDDETFNSVWCVNEVLAAAKHGVPVRFVVHTDRFHTRELIDKWRAQQPAVADVLLREQGMEYSTVFRQESVDKIESCLKLKGVDRIRNVYDATAERNRRGQTKSRQSVVVTRRRASTFSVLMSQNATEEPRREALALFCFRVCVAISIYDHAVSASKIAGGGMEQLQT